MNTFPLKCMASALGLLMAGTASAQTGAWPSRPIVISMPYSPGSVDITIRLYTNEVQKAKGWNLVIEPRPGGNGVIAGTAVLKEPADGHALMVSSGTLALGDVMETKPPYDGWKEFTPVFQLTRSPQLVVVNAATPIRNMKEYVAYAKANPGKINWGMTGTHGIQRLVGEQLHRQLGVEVTFVPYKSSAQMMVDLLGGNVHGSMQAPRAMVSAIKSGKIRPVGVSLANGRSNAFPQVLSIAEQTGTDFDYAGWFGLHAKTGTPQPIITSLNAAFNAVTKLPEFVAKMDELGDAIGGGSPEDFRKFQDGQRERWTRFANQIGMKLSE